MKKYLSAIMVAMATFLVSCDPEDATSDATVSFNSPVAVWSDGTAVAGITVSGYSGEAVSIPVIFGGTAEKGVDFTVSAEAYTVGGAQPVTEIIITPTETGAGKTVSMTLSAPDGFKIGAIPMCQVEMESFVGYASFQKQSDVLKNSLEVSVNLTDEESSALILESPATVELEVDTEKSTAQEGVHFEIEFADDAEGVFIDAGEKSGTFTLKFLKAEAGHDVIVLKIAETSQFSVGAYPEMTIYISGPDWDKISGTWTMNEIVTDAQYFIDSYGSWMTITTEGFPELNAADKVTIDTEGGKFIADFQSAFSNYFLGESSMTSAGEFLLRTGMFGEGITLQLLQLDNINRYFTAGNLSENDEALVGVQITYDENGTELLDMYIIDYNPQSFLKELNEWFDPEPPVAAFSGYYINMTFKRAE